jgi:hypothetical protein
MTGASFHDPLTDRLGRAAWVLRACGGTTDADTVDEAAREITRLRQRVRDLDQALSDAEHRLTWGHH